MIRDLITQLQAETDRLIAFRLQAERLHGALDRREEALAAVRRELAQIHEVLEPR